MSKVKFDLNIEEILEDWEVFHAIREIIANALDEELLSKTKKIKIFKDEIGDWHIRDFGRGLKYDHFTQKENDEKTRNKLTIGKFGIGLKDALATFERNGIDIRIVSGFGFFTTSKSKKHGFEDLSTLHVIINSRNDPSIIGSDFILKNCSDKAILEAKKLFLRFSDDIVIEKTSYGEVLAKNSDKSSIYVNGMKVAEEGNFLFSYNITSLTKDISKALNRERVNVGRSAYSGRVKQILLSSINEEVVNALVTDLHNFEKGVLHDELLWKDVSIHACRILNTLKNVVFFTPNQINLAANIVDRVNQDGYEIITIPESVSDKIRGKKDISGNFIRDSIQYLTEWNENLDFEFINENCLSINEKKIFTKTETIFDLIGGKPGRVKDVKISQKMQISSSSFSEISGLWDPSSGNIIVKRSQLKNMKDYSGTLLHETAHALSRASDISRKFEFELTSIIGSLVAEIMKKNNQTPKSLSGTATRNWCVN